MTWNERGRQASGRTIVRLSGFSVGVLGVSNGHVVSLCLLGFLEGQMICITSMNMYSACLFMPYFSLSLICFTVCLAALSSLSSLNIKQ